MSEVCVVCGRRANRQCPAGSVLGHDPKSTDDFGGRPKRPFDSSDSLRATVPVVCSQCCGKGRRRTIDCPDSCPHFRTGARAALLKLAELSRDPDFELRHGEVLNNLRLGVTLIRRKRLPELKDSEVRQAFANVADTMRTRSSGLIYDFRSPDPRVQMLYDELVSVATLHERGEKKMAKVDPADLMKCLKYLERQAGVAEKEERGATFFLDLIAQSVSREFATREPQGLVRGE